MKSYELKPTFENLLSTFIDDTIGRDEDIYKFANILNEIDDCCSIAIDDRWGNGKTFFVKQTKMVLDAYNNFTNNIDGPSKNRIKNKLNSFYSEEAINFRPQVCVYYDAWENDNDDDPMLSLVYSIMKSANVDFLSKLDVNIWKLASSVMDFFTAKNWSDIIDSFQSDNPLESLQQPKDIEERIKDFLQSLLPKHGDRLIIFVDELDRCKPSYAVKLLERIKHYFSNDNITFVFSVNLMELQHTIKQHYGNDFDACRYLDRFFDLRMSLPEIDKRKFFQNMNFGNTIWDVNKICLEFAKNYKFSLREMGKYVRLMKIANYDITHSISPTRRYIDNATGFCLLYIVPVMIGLKIVDINKYNNFISGENAEPFISLSDHISEAYLWNYDESNGNVPKISKEERLKKVYEALFSPLYQDSHSQYVGTLEFDDSVREIILRTANLLSDFTNINADEGE